MRFVVERRVPGHILGLLLWSGFFFFFFLNLSKNLFISLSIVEAGITLPTC